MPAGAVTCPSCGEPQTRPERKIVTVLFADLAGYTSLAESLDPEDVFGAVRPWMTELRLIVEDHGGTVPQVMGDGFMALFGVPAGHEDDPERAVRAGLALARYAEREASRQDGVHFPGLHIGINTGEVIVAGSREQSGFAVVGDPVNVSARLAKIAEPGHVLVGEATRELTAARIRYGPRHDVDAKGKAAPVSTYEALGAHRAGSASARVRRTAFVGRDGVLRRLLEDAAAVREVGTARVRAIIGEPGLGKSRLAAELARQLPDFVVLAGASHPYGQRLPLAALAEAIASALGLAADAEPALVRRAVGAALRRTGLEGDEAVAARAQLERVLGLADAAPGGDAADRPGGTAVDPRLSARGAIKAITGDRPALVVLDDVHWADDDQLALLRDIADAPWSDPLLILALSRPEPAEWRHKIPTINLAGLGPGNARAVIEASVGGTVPIEVARRLIERADGNPLFLEESARMLVERGDLSRRGKSWVLADPDALERVPVSLRQLIAARLDRLPASAKRVVQDAAVGGMTTWDRLLARLQTTSDPASTESDLQLALAELESRDILRRQPGSAVRGAVELEFKHVVIRDVAYESLARADRATRHERTADWLRQALGEQGVAAIAHQYERAWELGRSAVHSDGSRAAALAATYLRRWGDSIFSAQPRLALSLYERGLAVAKAGPAAVDPADLASLQIGRAEALSEAGRHHEAIVAAEAARAIGDAEELPSMEGYALIALARAHSDLGEVGVARDLIERALAIFGEAGDPLGEGRAYHRLAEARRFEGLSSQVSAYQRAYQLYGRAGATRERGTVAEDVAYVMTIAGGRQATVWLERATRLAELSGDERGQAATRRAAAYAALYRGDLDRALRSAREARAPAEATGHRWIEVDTLLIEALVRSAAGTPGEALAIVTRLLAIADSVGARHLRALVLGAGARAAQRDGHPRRAFSWLGSMRRTLSELGAEMEMAEVDLLEATLQLERGAWDLVDRPSREGERVARNSGWRLIELNPPLLRGRAMLGAGDTGGAARELARAAGNARRVGATGLALLAEAALRQAVLLGGANKGDVADAPSTPLVSSLTLREPAAIDLETAGLLALQQGDQELAATAFSQAVRAWQLLGLTVWQARAEQMRANALRATNRKSAANASALRSKAILARIGSPLLEFSA